MFDKTTDNASNSLPADWWREDESLLAALREALAEPEPVPASLLAAGRDAYAWLDNDIELALLTFDSTVDGAAELAGVRAGSAAPRTLTYVGVQITIELEATSEGVSGQIVPPMPGHVTVAVKEGATHAVPVDEVGGFAIRPVPAGTWRLEFQTTSPDGERARLRTGWLRI
jgi:hypothetical protein